MAKERRRGNRELRTQAKSGQIGSRGANLALRREEPIWNTPRRKR